MAAVTFNDVSKVYPDGTRAVSGMDLDSEDGEFIVLVGPSGCGKTTALRMVAGLEDITEGEIRIGERVVNHVPARDRDIAMVFQSYALYPHLSVRQNMAFGLRLRKIDKQEVDRRVENAARILGLDQLLDKKPRALSGGQRQRVAMGRAIVREPQAFLMDEPLSNLDAKLRVQVRAEISALQRNLGVTTVYVTHDQVEAMTMGDRVAVMRKGELQQVAGPDELYERPRNVFVGGFIGSPAMNLLDARLERRNGGHEAVLGEQRIALDPELLSNRPALRSFEGREVILGIRPEALEDAEVATDAPRGPAAEGPGRAARVARLGDRGARRHRRAPGRDRGRARAGRGARDGARWGRAARHRDRGGRDHGALRSAVDSARGQPRRDGGRHQRPALLRSGDELGNLRRRLRGR